MGERGRSGSANGRSRENNELRGIMRIFDRTMLPPTPPQNHGVKISHKRCSVYIWPTHTHTLNSQHEKWDISCMPVLQDTLTYTCSLYQRGGGSDAGGGSRRSLTLKATPLSAQHRLPASSLWPSKRKLQEQTRSKLRPLSQLPISQIWQLMGLLPVRPPQSEPHAGKSSSF